MHVQGLSPAADQGRVPTGQRPPSVRYGHSPKTRWYHIDCCFKSFGSVTKKSKTITSLDDIERVRHVFPPSEVARIERLIAEHKVRLNAIDQAPPPKKRRAPSPSVPLPSACLPRPKRPRHRRGYSRPDVASPTSHKNAGPTRRGAHGRACRGLEPRRCASSRRRRRSASPTRRRRRSEASRRGRRTRRLTSSPSRRRRPT